MEIKTERFDETISSNRLATEIKKEVSSELEDSDETEDCDDSNSRLAGDIKMEVFTESDDSDGADDLESKNSTNKFNMEIKEEDFDEKIVALDKYNSDLNLVIDAECFSAKPLSTEGFRFMWAGARATHGASKGKFCFEVKILEHLNTNEMPKDEPDPHVVRVGVSVDSSTMQLGEVPLSYGYDGTGNITTNCQFSRFAEPFAAGDVILAAVDADSEVIQIGFSKNGKFLGWAFQVAEKELKGHSLFPHVLAKNVSFEVNFGQKDQPYFPLPDPLKDFTLIGCLPISQRMGGRRPPKRREDCEVIMMCGLPGAGKSTWAADYAAKNPDKKFNVLGANNVLDKMTVMGVLHPRKPNGKWDFLVHKANKCLFKLFKMGSKCRRNYILDQDNICGIDRITVLCHFAGFRCKVVVVFPSEAEYQRRINCKEQERQRLLREEGRRLPGKRVLGKYLLERKARFNLPKVSKTVDEVIYTELLEEDAKKLIIEYRAVHGAAGYTTKTSLRRKLKKSRKASGRQLDSGQGLSHRGNFWNRGGFEGGRGGFNRNRRGFDMNCEYNRRRGRFGRNMGGFDRNMGRFDRNMGGFDRNMGGFDRDMGGFEIHRGGFDWNVGRFSEDRGGFDRDMGGFDWSAGRFNGDEGGYDRDMGGFEIHRGGFDWSAGRFNGVRGRFDRDMGRF